VKDGGERNQLISEVTLPYDLEAGTGEIHSLGIHGDRPLRPVDKILKRADLSRKAGSGWLVS
jgi:hypothetical protein